MRIVMMLRHSLLNMISFAAGNTFLTVSIMAEDKSVVTVLTDSRFRCGSLRKTTDDEKLLAILEKRYQENKNNPKKASGLMARMQALKEMQRKQQEEMMRKQAELNEKKNNLGK